MSATAYPLQWPPQFPRTPVREASRFSTTLSGALTKVQDSLRLFAKDSGKKLDGIVISSNYALGVSNPDDPGVAVYFTWDGIQVCIPVDRYRKIEENLQAIHHVIEARRTELRHGTLALVRATFAGFAALPPPGKHWSDVLQVRRDATRQAIEENYRRLAKDRHPDRGGSASAMSELNAARAAALQEAAQ